MREVELSENTREALRGALKRASASLSQHPGRRERGERSAVRSRAKQSGVCRVALPAEVGIVTEIVGKAL